MAGPTNTERIEANTAAVRSVERTVDVHGQRLKSLEDRVETLSDGYVTTRELLARIDERLNHLERSVDRIWKLLLTLVVAVDRENLKPQQRPPYVICVRRASCPWEAEVYPATYRESLPTIRIPLRRGDADVTLNLQSLITQCYGRGRYAATLNYAADPDPPLPLVEAQWADGLLREAGLRK